MVLCRSLFSRSVIAFGFTLAVFCFAGLNTLAAQGRGGGNGNGKGNGGGNGGGGGGGDTAGWVDDFDSLDLSHWAIAGAETPVPGNSSQNFGTYDPNHVTLVEEDGNTYLRIELTQEPDPDTSVISTGGLLYSTETYGYGTYEWTLRMSSSSATPLGEGDPASGNVSAAFVYTNNSVTEIDFEFSGHVIGDFDGNNDETLYMANWKNKGPKSPPSENELTSSTIDVPGITSGFHTYRFIWEQGKITFCVNGVYATDHTTNVPSKAANVMMNHWGTNNPNGFGGAATTGATRYFYVDRVGYTPTLLGCGDSFPVSP